MMAFNPKNDAHCEKCGVLLVYGDEEEICRQCQEEEEQEMKDIKREYQRSVLD